jgi:hypothetical protein
MSVLGIGDQGDAGPDGKLQRVNQEGRNAGKELGSLASKLCEPATSFLLSCFPLRR